MKVRRIAIIGVSAVGKSTLGKRLSSRLGLPLVHMDQLWWKPNWVESEEAEVARRLLAELKKNDWILEGYVEPLGKERVEMADLVLYLDYGPLRCLYQGLKRMFRHRKQKRSEMPEGCTDSFSFSYLKTIFTRAERPEIELAIKGLEDKVTRLKSPQETKKFINHTL